MTTTDPSSSQSRYDSSAIATWANAITACRAVVAPLLFIIISGRKGSWLALALWFALSASDGIDGLVARRHGATRSGAFLDPLADKILVLGAMFTLVREDVYWVVPVVIIAAREVIISVYRTVAGSKGVSVPAKKLAKAKTVTQQFAVGFALFPVTARRAKWLWNGLLWVAVLLTVVTGIQYLVAARRTVAAQAEHA
jgi:CDP-diacylglycerol--glycerol-3-phosphate 3-phosphatidyltransferase